MLGQAITYTLHLDLEHDSSELLQATQQQQLQCLDGLCNLHLQAPILSMKNLLMFSLSLMQHEHMYMIEIHGLIDLYSPGKRLLSSLAGIVGYGLTVDLMCITRTSETFSFLMQQTCYRYE
jgi:hypothetical protein